jgi:hypothetical protein
MYAPCTPDIDEYSVSARWKLRKVAVWMHTDEYRLFKNYIFNTEQQDTVIVVRKTANGTNNDCEIYRKL